MVLMWTCPWFVWNVDSRSPGWRMTWLEQRLENNLVEMELKWVLVKCEVYLSSAFEPCVKDCLANELINRFFLIFPGWTGASEGMSTLMLPKVVCGRYFFSSWGPQTGRNKTKNKNRRTCQGDTTRQRWEKPTPFFVNRLSKRRNWFPSKSCFSPVWEQWKLHGRHIVNLALWR